MRDATGRFKTGASGNPRGRPRDRGLQAEIERALAGRVGGKTRLQLVAEMIVDLAVGGDLRACDLIARRLWPEKLALEGGKPEVLVRIRDFTGRSPPETIEVRHPIMGEVIGTPGQLASGLPTAPVGWG